MAEYAIVVATRNRLDMLQTTLPLFIAQSRRASRVVIVDRSDDHGAVRRYCEDIARDTPIPFVVLEGREANLPSQRNQGLQYVEDPIVMYPDDDSMWYKNTAEEIMLVYEADIRERFGAVSATPVYIPPDGASSGVPRQRPRITNIPNVMRIRNRIESMVVPQPFEVFGRERISELTPLSVSDGLRYPLVETIGGYRMSFRTSVAKRLQFDPVLGSRIGYAIHEDKDMGLRVLASGALIAAAPRAYVFHAVAPGKRANGWTYGFFHILNYLYVCRKVFSNQSRALAVTRRYLGYKVLLYAIARRDQYSRELHAGAKEALSEYEAILSTAPEDLAARYAEVCDRHATR